MGHAPQNLVGGGGSSRAFGQRWGELGSKFA